MKRVQKKILLTLAALVVFAVSCKDSFLEVLPTASIVDSQLPTKAGLEGQLIGIYSMLSGRGDFYAGNTNWFWGSVMGGEANKGTNSGDQGQMNEVQNYNTTAGNPSVLNKYRAMYEGIARANALFRTLQHPDPSVHPDDVVRITAEARFLRALYYFELKRLFNDTPYVDETVDYNDGINDEVDGINKVKNDKDLYPFIEADLNAAIAVLPETQAAPGRVNVHAAKAYLAKVLLYQHDYSGAKTLLDELIAEGQTANGIQYALVEKYGDLFRVSNDNNSESVFAIQSAAGTGSINNANPDFVLNYPYNGGPAGCCGFFQPSFELVNSFRTSGGLPLPGITYRDPAYELVTDQTVPASGLWDDEAEYEVDALVTVIGPDSTSRQYKSLVGTEASPNLNNPPLTSPAEWELTWEEDLDPVDPRLDHAVGRRGIPFMDHGRHPGMAWIRDQAYGGPYTPKKYLWSNAESDAKQVDRSSWTPGYTAHNIYLIRYADILLMAAECEIEVGGPLGLEQARAYVNMIRDRAANPDGFVMDGAFTAANYNIQPYALPWIDPAAAREAVRMERKLELSGEGHRFFDLIRWGVAATELNSYLQYEKTKVAASPFAGNVAFIIGKSEFQPIPQTEIDILGTSVLEQNPGY